MSHYPGDPAIAQPDDDAMAMYYASMYPPLVYEYYPHVVSVVDEMDDPSIPMLPRERFEAMTDRIMSRIEGAQMAQFPAGGFDRRRNPARALIIALLISELLRRRRRRRF